MTAFRLRCYLVLSLLLIAAALPVRAQSAPSKDLLLILDASGSMWGQTDGENKIVIARRLLKDLAERLPEDSEAGLIAYGHRREGDCGDIETITPIGPLDKAALIERIESINPKGKTPITASIEQAVAALRQRGEPATVVLLSDGVETCGGDPCATVRQAKESGADFLLHVIGFDLAKENVAQLECAAQAGGGLYFPAENAQELASALEQATIAPQPAGDSALSVKAVLDGELVDVMVEVKKAGASDQTATGRTYASPETNPRVFQLAAGLYDVTVRALRLRGESTMTFPGVEIPQGETVEKVVDFSSGELSIEVLRNGELSDATYSVLLAGDRERAARGRTYRSANSNPRVILLTPGLYDVEIGSVEISNRGAGKHRFESVRVEAGKRVELSHEFQTGTLRIGAKQGAELVDVTVHVVPVDDPAQSAAGRTYVSEGSNPKAFTLLPGRYQVRLGAVRLEGRPRQEIEVEVAAGETVERIVEF